MSLLPIYSIGHGTRSIADFIGLLVQYGITRLADVRSKPYSRFNPQYNQKALKQALEQEGITYIFMGDMLGGRPDDPTCYTNGHIDYAVVRTRDWFRQGITQLQKAYEQQMLLAVMCSESDPRHCHRSKLIGEALAEAGVPIQHIDEKGNLKQHREIISQAKLF